MANYLKFTVMVGLEYAAAMFLMVSMFKLNDRRQWLKLTFICLLSSQVSFVMCLYGPKPLIPLTTVLVWLICMRLLFPLRWFYAAVVTIHTYLIFGMIQGSLLLVALLIVERNGMTSLDMDMVSLLSVLIAVMLAYYVRWRNWGLSFVPGEIDAVTSVRDNINAKMVIGMLIAMASFLGSYIVTLLYGNVESFVAFILLMLPILGVLVYFLWMKEVQKYARKIPVIVPKPMIGSGE